MPKAALIAVALVALAGCPSKEGEQKDANAGGGGGPTGAPPTGPLAQLESAPFQNEVWNMTGQQIPILYYPRENVRVSSQCRNPAGQLGCSALHAIRGGTPVTIAKSELTGKPAGVIACKKLNNGMMMAVNAAGNEEQFCRFPDGSWLSTNTLEQYAVKVQ